MTDAAVWLRMCDEDRERYGGPEWLQFDVGDLFDAPGSELEALEKAMNFPIFMVLNEFDLHGSRGVRAALWIARRRAGITEKFDDFDPKTLKVRRRAQPEEPAPASSGNAEAGETATEASPDGLKDEQ